MEMPSPRLSLRLLTQRSNRIAVHVCNVFLAIMPYLAYINQHWRDKSRHYAIFGENRQKGRDEKTIRQPLSIYHAPDPISVQVFIRFSFKCLADSDGDWLQPPGELAQKKIRTGRIFLASLKSFFLASCSFRFFLPLHAGFFVMFSFSGFSNDAGACHLSAETLQRII